MNRRATARYIREARCKFQNSIKTSRSFVPYEFDLTQLAWKSCFPSHFSLRANCRGELHAAPHLSQAGSTSEEPAFHAKKPAAGVAAATGTSGGTRNRETV